VHHGNRYGRSERARQAVLEAVDDLLVERGFDGVTIEGIAVRAGVAKQTIYRWWSSKVDILLDAFVEDGREHLDPSDHGDLGLDLRMHLGRLAVFLVESDAGAVFRTLIAQSQHDREVAARLRTGFLLPQRERDRLPLERAVRRGQLPGGIDLDTALDQLVGPIYYRVLVTGQPVPPEFTDGLVQGFLVRHGCCQEGRTEQQGR